MKFNTAFLALLSVTTPALAFETEEIGMIEAVFGDEVIKLPTVIARDGDEEQATAYLLLNGPFTTLSINSHSPGAMRISLDVEYNAQQPGPDSIPFAVTIIHARQYAPPQWTSEDRPTQPSVTFTTFEHDGTAGRAVGTFTAELCLAEDYEGGGDPDNCQMIEGRFDTRFAVESLN